MFLSIIGESILQGVPMRFRRNKTWPGILKAPSPGLLSRMFS
jgi:hypothetical protein